MKLHIFSLGIVVVYLNLANSSPIPQDLTEAQFKSGKREGRQDQVRDVKIVSGYSRVARFGKGFENNNLKDYGPIKVADPFDFQPNAIQRTVVFDDDKAPVFDLEEMLRQQEIKRRIEEANRREEEKLRQEEKEKMIKELEQVAELAKEDLAKTAVETIEAFDESLNKILEEADKEEQSILDEIDSLKQEVLEEAKEDKTVLDGFFIDTTTVENDNIIEDATTIEYREPETTTFETIDESFETDEDDVLHEGKFIRRGEENIKLEDELELEDEFEELEYEEEVKDDEVAEDEEEEEATAESHVPEEAAAESGDHDHDHVHDHDHDHDEGAAAEEPAPEESAPEEASEHSDQDHDHPPMEIDLGSVQEV